VQAKLDKKDQQRKDQIERAEKATESAEEKIKKKIKLLRQINLKYKTWRQALLLKVIKKELVKMIKKILVM
jgi:hypothetical protein